MSILKKGLSIVLVFILTFTFSACGGDGSLQRVISLEDEEISAGLYLAFLLESYNAANNKRDDEDQKVFDTTIDGKKASDWIKDEAMRSCKIALILPREAGEQSVVLTSTDIESIENQAKQQFSYFNSYYVSNGIGQESLKNILTIQKIADSLFTKLYGEGGDSFVSNDEVDKYFRENYSKIKYVSLPLSDENGDKLSDDKVSTIENLAKEFVEKASNGEDFDTLSKTYYETAMINAGRSISTTSTTYTNDNFINNTKFNVVYNQEFTNEIISKDVNEVGYKIRGKNIIVYQKLEITDTDCSNERSSNLKEYKQEEYYDNLLEKYKNYYFDINQEAINFYTPEKIK